MTTAVMRESLRKMDSTSGLVRVRIRVRVRVRIRVKTNG